MCTPPYYIFTILTIYSNINIRLFSIWSIIRRFTHFIGLLGVCRLYRSWRRLSLIGRLISSVLQVFRSWAERLLGKYSGSQYLVLYFPWRCWIFLKYLKEQSSRLNQFCAFQTDLCSDHFSTETIFLGRIPGAVSDWAVDTEVREWFSQ